MSNIEKLTPGQISTDRRVQRALDQHRVQAIVEKLNLDTIGVPVVSRRDTGALVVVDGQHRLDALRAAGYAERPMDMLVFDGLTLSKEAELFRLFNNTKNLTTLDRFRIALVEEDPETLAIDAIVRRNGYVTSSGSANSAIAVTTMRAIYKRDLGDTLNRALTVCNYAWGHRKHATHQTTLNALALMLFRYGTRVNLARLSDKIKVKGESANPTDFLGTIRALADATGRKPAEAGAGKLVTIYNRNLDQNSELRLPEWG